MLYKIRGSHLDIYLGVMYVELVPMVPVIEISETLLLGIGSLGSGATEKHM